jgi:hypothetical protein
MPVPAGYDLGLLHAAVNGGGASGWFLADHDEAFVEEQAIRGDVAVDTTGLVSIASYGLGPNVYRLRLALRADVLDRNRRPKTETPAALRTLLLQYAAQTAAITLQLVTGDRAVLFVEGVKFISGPAIDGYIALVTCVDVS